MRILFLNTDLSYGGAENMMLWLAGRLANNGFDVTFLTYRNPEEIRELPNGVKHDHIQLESDGHSYKGLIISVNALHKYIKSNKFDLGIAFLSPSQLRLSLAAIGTKMNILFSHRGDPYQSKPSNSLMSMIGRYAFGRADKYVFQTQKASEYFSDKIRKRSIVIPNPVKPLKRTTERLPDNRIVCVARLDNKQKRQDILIEAFKIISSKFPEVSLNIFGDGPDEMMLRDLAKDCDRIVFEGLTLDVVNSIQNARIFVLSSDFEGIPNALIEAMSLGVPCISTKCSPGGAELLIQDGYNGLLTDCGDAKAIADAIRCFLDNPSYAEQCGLMARKIVDDFSEDYIFTKWLEFINA